MLSDDELVKKLLIADVAEQESLVRQLAERWGEGVIRALQGLGEPLAVVLANRLQNRQMEHDSRVRAAQLLSAMNSVYSMATMLEVLQSTDDDVDVRSAVAAWLATAKDPEVVDALLFVLSNRADDVRVRKNAAIALGEIGDLRATEQLVDALRESLISNSVAHALQSLKDPRAPELLLPMLGSNDERLRAQVAALIGKTGPSIVDSLLPMLTEEDNLLRGAAVRALGFTGDQDSTGALINLIECDCEETVRAEAATALAYLGGGGHSFVALVQALQDHSVLVRLAAAQSLYHLGTMGKWTEDAFKMLQAAALRDPGTIEGQHVVREASSRAISEIERIR